jgi:hypothetical protein
MSKHWDPVTEDSAASQDPDWMMSHPPPHPCVSWGLLSLGQDPDPAQELILTTSPRVSDRLCCIFCYLHVFFSVNWLPPWTFLTPLVYLNLKEEEKNHTVLQSCGRGPQCPQQDWVSHLSAFFMGSVKYWMKKITLGSGFQCSSVAEHLSSLVEARVEYKNLKLEVESGKMPTRIGEIDAWGRGSFEVYYTTGWP